MEYRSYNSFRSTSSERKARSIFFLGWTVAVAVAGFFIARAILDKDEESEPKKQPDKGSGDGGTGDGGDENGPVDTGPPVTEGPKEPEEPEDEGLDVGTFWQIIIGLQYAAFVALVLVKDKNPVLVASVLLVYIILCDIQIFAIPNAITDGTVSGVVLLVTAVFWLNRLVLTNLEKLTFTLGMLSIFILSLSVRATEFQKYLDAEPDLKALPVISFLAFAALTGETIWQYRRIGKFKLDESYTTWLEDQLEPEVENIKQSNRQLLEEIKPYEQADSKNLTQEDIDAANSIDRKILYYNNVKRDLEYRIRKLEQRAKRRETIGKAMRLLGEVTTLPDIERKRKRSDIKRPVGEVEKT